MGGGGEGEMSKVVGDKWGELRRIQALKKGLAERTKGYSG